MYFKGAKMTKATFTNKLAKRLAKRAKKPHSAIYDTRAGLLIEGGAYEDYLKQFKKPNKEVLKDSKED
tara:strand:+ start:488 stop:691 length:204 start_codon:yes stop_codon:yes gene_type:complete